MRSWIATKTYSRVLVHTLAGDSYDGVLTVSAKDGLVLEDVILRSDRDTKLTGSMFVPREQVRMIQTLVQPRSTQ